MRFLVVKLADIGDVLTVTPALRALCSSFPSAQITVLVTPGSAEALRGLPYINEIILFDKFRYDRPWDALRPHSLAAAWSFLRQLHAGHFDAVLIFHHLTTRWGALKYAALALASGAPRRIGLNNGRGWFLNQSSPDRGFGAVHEVDYWLEVAALLGASTTDRQMEIAISDVDRAWAAHALAAMPQSVVPDRAGQALADRQPTIAIHAGSGGYILSRRWLPERFAEVADRLAERYSAQIVLVGGPGETAIAQAVSDRMQHQALNLTGQTSIKQLAATLKLCTLFIGGDSGVMHIAATVGTPVVALFGPTNEQAWGPFVPPGSDRRAAVVRAPGTRPVMYVGSILGKEQEETGRKAMAAITPDMVLAATERILPLQAPIVKTEA